MQTSIAKNNYNEATELRALFETQLRELYWAEGAMANMLCGFIAQASSAGLVKLLEKHTAQTRGHIMRLEDIFYAIGIPNDGLPYEAVACFIKEAESLLHITQRGVVRDAGLIAVLQKIKHYEIACYGTMRAYAIALREESVVTLLEQTLEEEKGTDLLLTALAEMHINIEAADKEV